MSLLETVSHLTHAPNVLTFPANGATPDYASLIPNCSLATAISSYPTLLALSLYVTLYLHATSKVTPDLKNSIHWILLPWGITLFEPQHKVYTNEFCVRTYNHVATALFQNPQMLSITISRHKGLKCAEIVRKKFEETNWHTWNMKHISGTKLLQM
jgi:hypothetical protein